VSGGGGGGSIDEKNIVYVDTQRATQAGEVYATLATAITYINTQSPGTSNPWVIYVQPGTNTETVTIPVSTVLVGHDYTKNLFTGIITLDTGATIQNARVGSGGKLYVASGKTGYVHSSDVVLGDAGGGLDGTVSATDSFIDGIVDASGVLMAYQSYLGVSSISSTGTVSTYNSSAFNFTNSGTWNNFGAAYRNTVLASGTRLTSTTTQGAIDELVVGTPTALFTLNVDETGNPDQDIDIVAEQGTEANGILRYDDGNNRWEMSNNGGGFTPLGGWFGSETRLKILPTDFISDDGDDNLVSESDGDYVEASSGTTQAGTTVAIPTGFRATHVLVYGSDTGNSVTVRANDITDGTTATSLGTGDVGTEINITDNDSTTTNYISIFVNLGNGDDIYGGYVTIQAIP
jgi:hypothetical protein